MLRSLRVIEVITHNITFPRITFRILLPWVARREVVNCGMGKVTWFYFLDFIFSCAFRTFHSAFYFPHSALTHFTDTLGHRYTTWCCVYQQKWQVIKHINCSQRWKETLSRVIYCCSPLCTMFLATKINSVQTTQFTTSRLAQLSKCTQVVR